MHKHPKPTPEEVNEVPQHHLHQWKPKPQQKPNPEPKPEYVPKPNPIPEHEPWNEDSSWGMVNYDWEWNGIAFWWPNGSKQFHLIFEKTISSKINF